MRLLSYLRIALVGFFMGMADLIPGVSGGTIAFICGIYDRFIDGLKTFDLALLRLVLRGRFREACARVPILFFLALGTGLVTAFVTLSGVLSALFKSHPVELWSLFFGLIAGSIVLLARLTWPWKATHMATFVLFTIGTYLLVGLPLLQTPAGKPFLFLAGAIAICAMILPGISGSYLLMIMGQYFIVLEALNAATEPIKLLLKMEFQLAASSWNWDAILSLAVFISGIVVGILSFVRIVSWFLHHHRQITLVALTGVMAGALRTVWPWKEVISTRINSKGEEVPLMQANLAPPLDQSLLIALGLALVGAALVLALSHLAPPDPSAKSEKK